MNDTQIALLRQRCDRGDTFTAEEVEALLNEIADYQEELLEVEAELNASMG